MNPKWTLRHRVFALCLLVIGSITLLAAGATTTAAANRGQLDNLLNSIGPMRTASNNLLKALLDEETGMRGFVLRGTEADLAPYTSGLSAEREATAAIEASPAANAEIKNRLRTVTRLAEEWRATVAEPAIARMRADGPQAAQAFLAGEAPRRFEGVRDAVNDLQASMQTVRDESVSAIRSSGTILLTVLLIAAVVVIVGGVGLILVLQRAVTRPVTDLAAQVRFVAAGNYEQRITTTGPPELTTLARDIDGLRRQIYADLAEVSRARAQVEVAVAQLEQQAAELTRSNRDLEQFAYVASHDLQEPLRKVASFCQLLQRRYAGQLDERADQYIAFAVNGAQRMQRLINDLLAFSRIGRATIGFGLVDLERVAAEVAGQLDPTTEPAPELTWSDLPVVHGEEPLLATLLSNLVNNSVKFRRANQPVRVHLSARRLGDCYEISCVDNGIGIEPEFAEKVFVIFQRLHARDAYPGTGIGLAIAKKIVEYHGGTIWIDTDHKGGAAIRFTVPAPPAEPAVPAAPEGVGEQPDGYSTTEQVTDPAQPLGAEEPV
ncbi:MAG: sensor histidine kinase [Micromonosporaceae bacterium]